MKRLAIKIAVAAALVAAFFLAFPDYSHRYRMTIEVDTPDGVRSGSSVIEVERKDTRWVLIAQGRFVFRLHGEAVFVDLGAGRNLIALLAHGAHGENVDQMTSLAIETYGHFKWDEKAWTGRLMMRGPVELKPPLIPTLVTFANLDDPKSARIVQADEFAQVFGPGVRFRRAFIDIVPVGLWPFTALGGPSSLAGEPVTRGIELKMQWLARMKAEGRGGRIDMHPGRFTLNAPYFTRD